MMRLTKSRIEILCVFSKPGSILLVGWRLGMVFTSRTYGVSPRSLISTREKKVRPSDLWAARQVLMMLFFSVSLREG